MRYEVCIINSLIGDRVESRRAVRSSWRKIFYVVCVQQTGRQMSNSLHVEGEVKVEVEVLLEEEALDVGVLRVAYHVGRKISGTYYVPGVLLIIRGRDRQSLLWDASITGGMGWSGLSTYYM